MIVLDRDSFDVFQDQRAEHNLETGEPISHRDYIRYCRLHNRLPAASRAHGGLTRSAPARTSLDEHRDHHDTPAGAYERTVQE